MENLVKQTEIAGMQSAGRVLPIWRGEYSDSAFYEQTDIVLYNNSSYIAKQDTTGNPPPEPTINSNAYWQLVAKGIIDADVSDATVSLTYESENREELQSGETTDTLFSKIRRWYSEFATVTFSGKYSDLSGTPGVASKSADGLVQKGNGQKNKVWKTDADGNPAWRDDANTQTITGIKGNAESQYRTGNVNLTPANIGAVATSKVLSTKEQINANTDTANVAGATAVKAMVSEINSNLANKLKIVTILGINTYSTNIEYTPANKANAFTYYVPILNWRRGAVVAKQTYGSTYDAVIVDIPLVDDGICVIRHATFLINKTTGAIKITKLNQANLQSDGNYIFSINTVDGIGLLGISW